MRDFYRSNHAEKFRFTNQALTTFDTWFPVTPMVGRGADYSVS